MTSQRQKELDSPAMQIAKSLVKKKGGVKGLQLVGGTLRTPKIKFYGPKIKPLKLEGNGLVIHLGVK